MEIVRKDTESDLLMDVFFADVLKGDTPFIGENGHWWIGLTDTGVTARGVDGRTPEIGANKHWWVGGVDTGVMAQGVDGKTPSIGSNGNWQIGGVDTGLGYNTIPTGVVVMWSGNPKKIPAGWALCDGQGVLSNGEKRPDLKGRFIIGFTDEWDVDYGILGNKGGSEQITIKPENLPSHNHKSGILDNEGRVFVNKVADNLGASDPDWWRSIKVEEQQPLYQAVTGNWGGNARGDADAIDIRPPYYVLAFIVKI